MSTEREREMADAIARAEEADEVEDLDRPYVRPLAPRRSAGDVYSFRLPQERRDQLREAAERRGVPPATLIRRWVEARLDELGPSDASALASLPRLETLGLSGNGLAGLPNLTLDTLRSLAQLGDDVPRLTAKLNSLHEQAVVLLGDLDQLTSLDLTGSTPPAPARSAERHVVPHPDGGWDVRAPGSKRASAHVATRAEAVRRAQAIVANQGGGDVVVFGPDGEARTSLPA